MHQCSFGQKLQGATLNWSFFGHIFVSLTPNQCPMHTYNGKPSCPMLSSEGYFVILPIFSIWRKLSSEYALGNSYGISTCGRGNVC